MPYVKDSGGIGLIYEFYDPAELATVEAMEFRLIYYGQLLKAAGRANPRVWEKHQIRLNLHPQIKRLWEVNPLLGFYSQEQHLEKGGLAHYVVMHRLTQTQEIAKRNRGYIPVVNAEFGMLCDLDILFLRSEPSGGVIRRDAGGGDIDNRMKTLLDALCIPVVEPERRESDPPDPNPFYVLMTDDSLITSLKITADRLLEPATNDPAEACVVIHAKVRAIDPLKAPYGVNI